LAARSWTAVAVNPEIRPTPPHSAAGEHIYEIPLSSFSDFPCRPSPWLAVAPATRSPRPAVRHGPGEGEASAGFAVKPLQDPETYMLV
jgi:hypothetical protein